MLIVFLGMIALFLVLGLIFSLVVGMWLFWAGIAAFLAVAFGTVIYANTRNRF